VDRGLCPVDSDRIHAVIVAIAVTAVIAVSNGSV
jgi:hypothetical protein